MLERANSIELYHEHKLVVDIFALCFSMPKLNDLNLIRIWHAI